MGKLSNIVFFAEKKWNNVEFPVVTWVGDSLDLSPSLRLEAFEKKAFNLKFIKMFIHKKRRFI